MSECQHPEKSREYDPGNWVPPYGWEQYPGWYCHDCGEMLEDDEVTHRGEPDPDLARKYELEDEMRNPL